jgi:hypothetical protein
MGRVAPVDRNASEKDGSSQEGWEEKKNEKQARGQRRDTTARPRRVMIISSLLGCHGTRVVVSTVLNKDRHGGRGTAGVPCILSRTCAPPS